jgi:hypothetical protein
LALFGIANMVFICKFIYMSTKTIAVNTQVYEKLAQRKRGSESFTKTINRLIDGSSDPTCADAVRETARLFGMMETDAEADLLDAWHREGAEGTDWSVERPE